MDDPGWIKLSRRLLEWEWFRDSNMLKLWICCLLKANHSPRSYMGVGLQPGQFISGRESLSEITGLSIQSVRTCINRLKSTSELTIKTYNKFSVFTINSWEKYQINDIVNQQINQQLTSNQPATNQQLTTNKNDKNERKEKKAATMPLIPESLRCAEFERAWESWTSYRREKRKPITPSTAIAQFKKFELIGVSRAIMSIEHTICMGWIGIREPEAQPDKQVTQNSMAFHQTGKWPDESELRSIARRYDLTDQQADLLVEKSKTHPWSKSWSNSAMMITAFKKWIERA